MPIYESTYTGAQIDENLGKGASALQPADIKNDLTSDDTDKPLSAAQGKALQDTKAPINDPTFTGTVSCENAAHVGLSDAVTSTSINDIVTITQGDYDALDPKVATRLYVIVSVLVLTWGPSVILWADTPVFFGAIA
jgi:hypothetical protein